MLGFRRARNHLRQGLNMALGVGIVDGYFEPMFLSAREVLVSVYVSVYFCDAFTLGIRWQVP